jgi:uncharacterized protein YabE (DUF348 family)
MPKVRSSVEFSQVEIESMLVEKARELNGSKGQPGSSSVELVVSETNGTRDTRAIVYFDAIGQGKKVS